MTRAPISLPGQTVIFDYGEVISLTPSAADREAITGLAGAGRDSERFWRAYFAHRDGLDQGSAGVAAYWQAIAADVGASWDDARVLELSLGNLAVRDVDQLAAVMKNRLKRIQYQPALIEAFLAQADLTFDP